MSLVFVKLHAKRKAERFHCIVLGHLCTPYLKRKTSACSIENVRFLNVSSRELPVVPLDTTIWKPAVSMVLYLATSFPLHIRVVLNHLPGLDDPGAESDVRPRLLGVPSKSSVRFLLNRVARTVVLPHSTSRGRATLFPPDPAEPELPPP